jgi:hypothetical protein
MKSGEIIRIILCTLLVLILAHGLQPLLYLNKIIYLKDVSENLNGWLSDSYATGAWTVVMASLIATIIWCVATARARVKGTIDIFRWSLVWWLLGLLPILGLGIALYNNTSSDAVFSLFVLFFINGPILLYWLPTALSSPGLFKHIPPGSFLLRRLIGA